MNKGLKLGILIGACAVVAGVFVTLIGQRKTVYVIKPMKQPEGEEDIFENE